MVMNCSESQIAMRVAIDGATALDAATRRHLATCEDCREDYADWSLERALKEEWVPPARDQFVDQAIAAATRKGTLVRARRFAMAASIAVLGIAIGLFFGVRVGLERDAVAARVTLVAHESKTVRFVIDSPSEQDSATVTIELADNLELAGFPNERRIEWQTKLSQGRNLLALPLTLTVPSDTRFRVGLVYGSTRKDIQVSVKAQPGQIKA
jgi:hypothetical protein